MIALLSLVFLFTSYLKSQTVDSIKVEQAGDFIKIRYQILNSTAGQTYRVKVLCSINGGLNTEIRSITGDVGDQVAGGKPEYWVIWDVLKDVDDVKSVDFSVRTELINDNSPKSKVSKDLKSRNFYILPSMGSEDMEDFKYGLRLAYMQSWGISAMYMRRTEDKSNHGEEYSDFPVTYASLVLTKRVSNRKNFNMHLFAGALLLHDIQSGPNASTLDASPENYLGFDVGFIMSHKRLAFSAGIGMVSDEFGTGIWDVGLGIRF